MQKKYTLYIAGILLFAVSAGISYLLFGQPVVHTMQQQPSQTMKKTATGSMQFDQSLPKTEACPLNGIKYSTQQRDWWLAHRPLGVMIENHEDARPQSGLSYADTVYEAIAEGGITRFLAVFYCQDAPTVGPVRSARTYFVDFISEYGDHPLYAHVGGANAPGPADALSQIESYGWNGYNDLNQFSIGFPTYVRDYDRLGHTVATEHTMYSSTSKLWQVGKERVLTNIDKNNVAWDAKFVKYLFKDDASINQRPQSQTIHIGFWQGQGSASYDVDWIYDPQTNVYKRNNGGLPHIDLDTKKQLTSKNIVILFMKEVNADDGYENNVHLLYQDKGAGKAIIFIDGKQTIGTWRKENRTARTLIYDENGNALKFDAGNIWFTILPLTGTLRVQ
jgi:hypothetical protein